MIFGHYAENGSITRARDGASIPADPANRDYREAMDALAAGDTIEAFVASETDPLTIPLNRFQFDAMLRILGLTDAAIEAAIDTAVTDPTENKVAKARYYKAEAYNRSHPLFALLAPEVGLTDAQIDAAWATAVTIN